MKEVIQRSVRQALDHVQALGFDPVKDRQEWAMQAMWSARARAYEALNWEPDRHQVFHLVGKELRRQAIQRLCAMASRAGCQTQAEQARWIVGSRSPYQNPLGDIGGLDYTAFSLARDMGATSEPAPGGGTLLTFPDGATWTIKPGGGV